MWRGIKEGVVSGGSTLALWRPEIKIGYNYNCLGKTKCEKSYDHTGPIHTCTELFSEWKFYGFQIIYIATNAHSIIAFLPILN